MSSYDGDLGGPDFEFFGPDDQLIAGLLRAHPARSDEQVSAVLHRPVFAAAVGDVQRVRGWTEFRR